MFRSPCASAQIARVLFLCAIFLSGRESLAGTGAKLRTDTTTGLPPDLINISGQTWPIEVNWLTETLPVPPSPRPPVPPSPVPPLAPHDVPPVLRAQSPEISLLPLAKGTAPIESTGLFTNYLTPLHLGNGRLRGDYVTDFDETEKVGMQILTQGGLGAGIDAEVNYWQRPVADLGREALWTGDLNMLYGVSPIDRFKVRAGVGGNWLLDQGETQFGYNFTYGVDIYLLWRGMFTAEIDYGEIGGDELLRYRLGLGMTIESFDVFAGYESQEIDDEELDGLMTGVAIWY